MAVEPAAAPRRGSLLPSLALQEVAAGARAASEAQFLTIVRSRVWREPRQLMREVAAFLALAA